MIRYALRCAQGHDFESWFRDSAAFDTLSKAGQVACAICGDTGVGKTIMAPAVAGAGKKKPAEPAAPLSAPASPAEKALKKLRDHLTTNSDYVGKEFATEARRIHDGEADKRSIWGEATPDDARALHDDGVQVAPIPWMSRRND